MGQRNGLKDANIKVIGNGGSFKNFGRQGSMLADVFMLGRNWRVPHAAAKAKIAAAVFLEKVQVLETSSSTCLARLGSEECEIKKTSAVTRLWYVNEETTTFGCGGLVQLVEL